MSIKKKIILIFSASFAIVAVFGLTAIYDFFEARRDFDFLKITDSIRSKTLQIRRHEKNFFLYGDFTEVEKIRRYFTEVDRLIKEGEEINKKNKDLQRLALKIREYKRRFNEIVTIAELTKAELGSLKGMPQYDFIIPIMKSTFLEHPEEIITILKKFYFPGDASELLSHLREIKQKVMRLRLTGEEIIDISREIDKSARNRVEYVIRASEVGILIVFPFAFLSGFIALFFVTQNIVKRLNELMVTIKKTGEGFYSPLPFPSGKDEVSTLIRTYNSMAAALKDREMQLIKKEEELIRHKKLAAIGTLASGVAHELNNPLNNIHLSAQILAREIKGDSEGIIKETVEDILSQTLRVKKIVGDLLEFAREKKPEKQRINITELIKRVYAQIQKIYQTRDIVFNFQGPEEMYLSLDPAQIERVFLNLFSNAIDAMNGKGEIRVRITEDEDVVKIEISDTGPGIPEDYIDKVFDPFFTTKDKGTGLGLSIVYNIVKNHYGHIEVISSDKGTTFIISLPREL
ncbi:MAG: HAMP domain-containing protein [Nitrospirae bacterium]|nr:HAMP domain-containing protein [Nitrospirota bacterium]